MRGERGGRGLRSAVLEPDSIDGVEKFRTGFPVKSSDYVDEASIDGDW